jgi:hypothetical protein
VFTRSTKITAPDTSLALRTSNRIDVYCAHDSSVTRWTYGASPAIYLLTYLYTTPPNPDTPTVDLVILRVERITHNVIESALLQAFRTHQDQQVPYK